MWVIAGLCSTMLPCSSSRPISMMMMNRAIDLATGDYTIDGRSEDGRAIIRRDQTGGGNVLGLEKVLRRVCIRVAFKKRWKEQTREIPLRSRRDTIRLFLHRTIGTALGQV